MKTQAFFILALPLLFWVGFFSKKEKKAYPTKPPVQLEETLPSFKKDIFPLLEQKCNMEDCHGPKGQPKYKDYESVKKNSKKIAKRIVDLNVPMPPIRSGIRLEIEEIQLLQRWIKAGAPNN